MGACHFRSYVGAVLFVIFLVGCGGGGDDAPPPPPNPTLSGVASKGPIRGGTVQVYEIDDHGQMIHYPVLGSAVTDDNGAYSITIDYKGPVLVEIIGGRYIDEAMGVELDVFKPLRAAIADVSGDITVAVTPLTELAVRMAIPGRFTPEKINDANEFISQLAGCVIITTSPADPSNPESFRQADPHSQNYALFLAVLSQMAMNDYSRDISGIIDDIEEDLEDLRLDGTGGAFSRALSTFINENPNNKTGIGNLADTELATIFDTIVQNGLTPTGSIVEAEILLSAFLNDPTEANFDAFMFHMDTLVPESKEAHLLIALAQLMDILNSEPLSMITGADGLAPFTAPDFDVKALIFNVLTFATYEQKVKGVFSELSKKLDEVDAELEMAYGVNAWISLPGFNTVYFDDTDINILRTSTKLLQAMCAYIQAINFEPEDWEVSTPDGDTDIRDILDNFTIEQIDELIDNNEELLTTDLEKVDAFRVAFHSATVQFNTVVSDLKTLGEEGMKLRYKNAFSVDSDYDLWRLISLAEDTFPSILNAFDNPAEDILIMNGEAQQTKVIVTDDGYAYEQTDYNLYLESFVPGNNQVPVYSVANEYDSLRAIWEDYSAAVQNNASYEPYWRDKDKSELRRQNVPDIRWDNPIDTFVIPEKAININGKEDDWKGVPIFYENHGHTVKVKLAHDDKGHIYFYVSFESTEQASWDHEWKLWSYALGNSADTAYSLSIKYEDGQITDDETEWAPIKVYNDIIGFEAKYSGLVELTKDGRINRFEWDSVADKILKLL